MDQFAHWCLDALIIAIWCSAIFIGSCAIYNLCVKKYRRIKALLKNEKSNDN